MTFPDLDNVAQAAAIELADAAAIFLCGMSRDPLVRRAVLVELLAIELAALPSADEVAVFADHIRLVTRSTNRRRRRATIDAARPS